MKLLIKNWTRWNTECHHRNLYIKAPSSILRFWFWLLTFQTLPRASSWEQVITKL